jgi:2-polyprenyl-6-methoxyphenol hydroxylase-like FAD-dependent oxidoreductase
MAKPYRKEVQMSRVIIVGGGPAGATLGCYLSIAGIENTIVDSANHPRAERVNDFGTPVVMRLVSKRVSLAAVLAPFSAG